MADPQPEDQNITLTLSKSGALHTLTLPSTALLTDLVSAAESHLLTTSPATLYDWSKAKFIASGYLLRSGPDDHKPIALLAARAKSKPIILQVPTTADITDIRASSDAAHAREARYQAQRRQRRPAVRTTATRDDTTGFLRIAPLADLRHPERSLALLNRLADDAGIRATMRTHGFSVGLLTEMEPLANTQEHVGGGVTRLLGLNRNAGEVIELRLRTDAGDGYRAYNSIRATLCHELAHNVHSPHDASFWALCHRIEREVAAVSVGRSMGEGDGFVPSAEEDVMDHGGWTGGTYVLGGVGGGSGSGSGDQGLSRRDVIANAAEERMKRAREGEGSESGSGSSDAKAPPEEGNEGGGSGTA